jgi:hypothetical protein
MACSVELYVKYTVKMSLFYSLLHVWQYRNFKLGVTVVVVNISSSTNTKLVMFLWNLYV